MSFYESWGRRRVGASRAKFSYSADVEAATPLALVSTSCPALRKGSQFGGTPELRGCVHRGLAPVSRARRIAFMSVSPQQQAMPTVRTRQGQNSPHSHRGVVRRRRPASRQMPLQDRSPSETAGLDVQSIGTHGITGSRRRSPGRPV